MSLKIENNEVTAIKSEAATFGFTRQMSLYGVLTDSETKKSEYRRIEVIANKPYTAQDVEYIHRFFKEVKPAAVYTIWLYHNELEAIHLLVSFN